MASQKTALIMGVANKRSIAWACVQSFLSQNYRVVFTYQNERFESTAHALIGNHKDVHALPCNVESEIPHLFQERIPDFLGNDVKLHAIVHSIAFAPDMKQHDLLQTSRQAFHVAHDISTYSFLETARHALPLLDTESSSLTALSYLGAVKAIPYYNVMGPAKASLESVVRGLALELGNENIRVNAVSAGPLNTLAARGIAGISEIRQDVEQRAPLKRNVTAEQVADTISFLATRGTGITGQTIYVDGGYSIVAGP